MNYLSIKETAAKWGLSERTVRNYCNQGKIPDAFMTGKTWNVPETATRPDRINKHIDTPTTLLEILKEEKANHTSGGIYAKTQIELTYNSNHIEGSKLTHDQTRYIYETNTIGTWQSAINVDDIVETVNHFRCIDLMIEEANAPISERIIKQVHFILKNGTSDSRKSYFVVGDYKKLPNEVGGKETTSPEDVKAEIQSLIEEYNQKKGKTLEDIIEFHVRLESIHPFQDGNGRVGRLIVFKECLKHNIVPCIIEDDMKMFYYRGLSRWNTERGYLINTFLTGQDRYKKYLDYFRIKYID